jgi:hypothetical protein
MTAITKTLSRKTGIKIDVESLTPIIIFCGFGLLVSLAMAMTYGLDLSPGFF